MTIKKIKSGDNRNDKRKAPETSESSETSHWIYGQSQLTPNRHASSHASTNFCDFGPMEGYNAFIFQAYERFS